jgi:iron complex outermembrane receptor protein
VPPTNPFNPCNPAGIDGVDCVVAWNDFWKQQTVIDIFTDEFGVPPSDWGLDANQPVGPIWVRSRTAVLDDRRLTFADVEQIRGVLGVRGNLPGFSADSNNNWDFDVAFVYSESGGESSRPGIRRDRLEESLYTSMISPITGEVVCGSDIDGDGVADGITSDGMPCVPVNLFAPTLFANVEGNFATEDERDYLFDTRDFDTRYKQWFVTGFVSGELFELPAGPVNAVFGIEHREDEIRSIPDDVAKDRLFVNFFADAGAIGEKYTSEVFAEVELPLLSDLPGMRLLTLNASGRYTRDEFFGSHTTYAAKLGWRPHDSLLVRATTGTSFRAPNLRENFYIGGRGTTYFNDPCAIPEDAISIDGGYDPSLDPREPHVLENCRQQGVDPTTFNLGGWNSYLVDYEVGGTTEIVPETSDAYSYGFVWDQPVFEAFGLTIGASYYNIDISDTIIGAEPHYFVQACYNDVGLDSTLCHRVTRDPDTGLMTLVDADVVNRDKKTVSGYDINVAYSQDLTLFRRPFDLSIDLVANHPTEVSETYVDEVGSIDYEDEAGRWGYPEWHGTATMRVDTGNYRFTWRTRYVGPVEPDTEGRDPWSDIYEGISDTCFGPTDGDVLCRDVDFADEYVTHNLSLYWRGKDWTVGGGVRNVFDESPPLIDGSEVPSFRNTPLGFGYDANGRVYFFNVQARFD